MSDVEEPTSKRHKADTDDELSTGAREELRRRREAISKRRKRRHNVPSPSPTGSSALHVIPSPDPSIPSPQSSQLNPVTEVLPTPSTPPHQTEPYWCRDIAEYRPSLLIRAIEKGRIDTVQAFCSASFAPSGKSSEYRNACSQAYVYRYANVCLLYDTDV